ncbi:MAG TPA: phosphodiester glycosidase family protein, partial [Longimicrobiaceae bacterium]|nr:phosphodiester glycosidase family protein [Longimicrobiaceae bacterium]
AAAVLAGLLWSATRSDAGPAARGGEAQRIEFRGARYLVFTAELERDSVHLLWRDAAGNRFGSLGAVREHLAARGRRVRFAMNAGMFDPQYRPVGLHVEDGRELTELNLRDSTGNFYLKPNGVFLIAGKRARIVASPALATGTGVDLATQSGPLLVQRGGLHPRLSPASRNRFVRNGVGVIGPTRVVFAISEEPVTFHDFAVFFRDALGCADALFLDGAISKAYAPGLGKNEDAGDFAGILAVTRGE